MRSSLFFCAALLGSLPLLGAATTPTLSLDVLFKPIQSLLTTTTGSATYTLSGTTGDSADYIILYQATDNTCISPTTDTPVVIANGTPLNLGTPYTISPAAIDTFLNSPTSGTYYIGIYFKSSLLSCTTPSALNAYCGANFDSTHANTCMQATYSSSFATGGLTMSQHDNTLVNLDTPAEYSYSPDANNLLHQCLLNYNGSLSACLSSTTLPNNPSDIVFATVNNALYGYVPLGSSGIVYSHPTTGGLVLNNYTSVSTQFTPAWTSPSQIAFATVNSTQYAYVTDSSTVYQCSLANNGGDFTSCTSISTTTPAASGIAIATVNGTQYAYLVDSSSQTVNYCSFNTDGTFNVCTSIGTAIQNPNGIAITTVNGTQYAYIVDSGSSMVDLCALETDGSFSSCSGMKVDYVNNTALTGISFGTVNGTQYAYVSDASSDQSLSGGYAGGKLWQCSLTISNDNTNGTFDTCSYMPSTAPSPSWSVSGSSAVSYMTA